MNRWDNYGELYHHGILGQKWGVRRYQNEDGTLTEEGKKRYHYTNDSTVTEISEGLTNYAKDTMRRATRDVKKEVQRNSEYNVKAGAKAGVVTATSLLLSVGVGMLVPTASTGAAVGGALGAQNARRKIYSDGREAAARALGYEDLADMTIRKYDEYAKKAGMPGMKSTYKYLYGTENYMYHIKSDANLVNYYY